MQGNLIFYLLSYHAIAFIFFLEFWFFYLFLKYTESGINNAPFYYKIFITKS